MFTIQPNQEATVGATPQASVEVVYDGSGPKFEDGTEVRILAHPFDEDDPEVGTLATVVAFHERDPATDGDCYEVRLPVGGAAYYGEDELELAS